MNSSFGLATAYTDNTVQAGETYYYVTTAVDSRGIESVFSNETMAVIPTP
jgi:fibronectin type 3 domain-containing protein